MISGQSVDGKEVLMPTAMTDPWDRIGGAGLLRGEFQWIGLSFNNKEIGDEEI